MKVIKTMLPGEKGTQRLCRDWGDQLLSVRYRENGDTVLTTIEIIVDERKKLPHQVNSQSLNAARRREVVAVRVGYHETELRAKIKRSGGRWSPQLKLWLIPYGTTVRLALKDRIQQGMAEKCTDIDTSLLIADV